MLYSRTACVHWRLAASIPWTMSFLSEQRVQVALMASASARWLLASQMARNCVFVSVTDGGRPGAGQWWGMGSMGRKGGEVCGKGEGGRRRVGLMGLGRRRLLGARLPWWRGPRSGVWWPCSDSALLCVWARGGHRLRRHVRAVRSLSGERGPHRGHAWQAEVARVLVVLLLLLLRRLAVRAFVGSGLDARSLWDWRGASPGGLHRAVLVCRGHWLR